MIYLQLYRCRLCGELYEQDRSKDISVERARSFVEAQADIARNTFGRLPPMLHDCKGAAFGIADLAGVRELTEG